MSWASDACGVADLLRRASALLSGVRISGVEGRDASERGEPGGLQERRGGPSAGALEGVVRTLEVPEELCLDAVETINIDQSQGAIIISVRDGKIFILCYE